MCVAAAITGAAAVGAGASIYSADKASSAQKSAANQANATEQNAFNTTQANLSPYMQNGTNALARLNSAGTNMNSWLQSTPGYNFSLQQGLKAVQNGAAARGLGTSGAAQKGAAAYASGLASNTYQQQFGNLLSQAGLGENAAAGVGNAAVTTATNQGNNTVGAGNATGAASLATGNALGNAAYSVPNSLLTQQAISQFGNNNGIYGGNSLGSLTPGASTNFFGTSYAPATGAGSYGGSDYGYN